MVIVLEAQLADTPAGKPVGAPIPVAPVVAIVIEGLIAVFKQTVGFEDGVPAVLAAVTVMVLLAVVEQPHEFVTVNE
jgi:hypothetical protein